jgi:hypothetical protein
MRSGYRPTKSCSIGSATCSSAQSDDHRTMCNLSRPADRVSFLTVDLEAKRLGLLNELFSQARKIAALVDPNSAESETQLRNVQQGARTLNRKIQAGPSPCAQ